MASCHARSSAAFGPAALSMARARAAGMAGETAGWIVVTWTPSPLPPPVGGTVLLLLRLLREGAPAPRQTRVGWEGQGRKHFYQEFTVGNHRSEEGEGGIISQARVCAFVAMFVAEEGGCAYFGILNQGVSHRSLPVSSLHGLRQATTSNCEPARYRWARPIRGAVR